MSRTDKDIPWELQGKNHYPCHGWRCIAGIVECSLPVERTAEFRKRYSACYWKPDFIRKHWQGRAPRWYINDVWTNPNRVKKRDVALNAKADYRANGYTEIQPDTNQHRHGANWNWW